MKAGGETLDRVLQRGNFPDFLDDKRGVTIFFKKKEHLKKKKHVRNLVGIFNLKHLGFMVLFTCNLNPKGIKPIKVISYKFYTCYIF